MTRTLASAYRRFLKALEYLLYALLLALVVIVTANIVARSIFNNSLPWTEELSRFLFVWVTFVGSVLVNDSFGHMRMDILPNALKGRGRRALDAFVSVIVMLVLAILIWGGWSMMRDNLDYRSAALAIPYGWINAVVPVACLVMFLQTTVRLFVTLRGRPEAVGLEKTS